MELLEDELLEEELLELLEDELLEDELGEELLEELFSSAPNLAKSRHGAWSFLAHFPTAVRTAD